MNKTSIIKKIIGNAMEGSGFKYIRCERGIVWTFRRTVGDVEQEVFVQQHTKYDDKYKLIFWTSAKGNVVKEIGSVIPKFKGKEYWVASTDEEFLQIMNFFASFIVDYGLRVLEEMLADKQDSFETAEVKEYFQVHRRELLNKYEQIYHVFEEPTPEEQIKKIDEILYLNREAEETYEETERIRDLWLGMAAILCEIFIKYAENSSINYSAYRVEIELGGVLRVTPIFDIVQTWMRYHFEQEVPRPILLHMNQYQIKYLMRKYNEMV